MQLLKFNKACLYYLGLWPKTKRNFCTNLYTALMLIFQVGNLTSGIINLIQCSGEIKCSLENITYTIQTVSGVYVYTVFLLNEKTYRFVLASLEKMMYQFKSNEYTIKIEQFSNTFLKFATIYGFINLFIYNIIPIIDYKNCIAIDRQDSASICGLPTPGWYPFDKNTRGLGFIVFYIFQFITAYLYGLTAIYPTVFSGVIIYHIIAHLKMIQDGLNNLCSDNIENKYNYLQHLVKHHSSVIEQIHLYLIETIIIKV